MVPWSITRYANPAEWPVAVLGLAVAALGLAALVACFVQFVREGRGTPAPIAPTEELVVGGLYRWVRNPMYLAVGAIIVVRPDLVYGARPILQKRTLEIRTGAVA